MQWLGFLLIGAAVFGLCFLVDRGFTKLFRSRTQHKTGLSVRLNQHYGGMGLVLALVGIAGILYGLKNPLMLAGGAVVLLVGVGLVVYYMTFSIFYDEESFLLTTFGKKTETYCYSDIQCQQLYNNGGTVLIELHMTNGRSVQLVSTMVGVYPFMDKAFSGWLRQTGRREEDCPFHDPANSCWFPPVEG